VNEKRAFPRVAWSGKVTVSDSVSKRTITGEGRMRNFSKSGFAMVAEESMVRGVRYKFTLNTDRGPLSLEGRIVHVRRDATYFYYGIKFESASLGTRMRLNRLLAARSPKMQQTFLLYSVVGAGILWGALKFLMGLGISGALVGFFTTAVLLYLLLPF
jgi:hypothetical protein